MMVVVVLLLSNLCVADNSGEVRGASRFVSFTVSSRCVELVTVSYASSSHVPKRPVFVFDRTYLLNFHRSINTSTAKHD